VKKPFPRTRVKVEKPISHESHQASQPALNQPAHTKNPSIRKRREKRLTTEAVESAALSLESIDDVKRGNSLALGVLSVGDGVADDALEEGFEDTARLLVNHGRDTLDTTTTRQTADGGLGDTLDVVTKNLAMALGTALAEALAALAAWRELD